MNTNHARSFRALATVCLGATLTLGSSAAFADDFPTEPGPEISAPAESVTPTPAPAPESVPTVRTGGASVLSDPTEPEPVDPVSPVEPTTPVDPEPTPDPTQPTEPVPVPPKPAPGPTTPAPAETAPEAGDAEAQPVVLVAEPSGEQLALTGGVGLEVFLIAGITVVLAGVGFLVARFTKRSRNARAAQRDAENQSSADGGEQ